VSEAHDIVRQYVEEAGHLSQSLGLGRAVGQVYAYLYFSHEPRGLADLQSSLGISKGTASMTVRQLEQWGAVRKVWVKGDRKNYYESNDWIGQIIRNILIDTVGKRLAQANGLLSLDLDHSAPGAESAFVLEKIQHLRRFQERVRKVWENPVVKRLVR
jgi:DNA-binding transcriptional regulator GbsR (MarR family)